MASPVSWPASFALPWLELRGLCDESLEELPRLFEEDATAIIPARIDAELFLRSWGRALPSAALLPPGPLSVAPPFHIPVARAALGWLGVRRADTVALGARRATPLALLPVPAGTAAEAVVAVPLVRARLGAAEREGLRAAASENTFLDGGCPLLSEGLLGGFAATTGVASGSPALQADRGLNVPSIAWRPTLLWLEGRSTAAAAMLLLPRAKPSTK